jgi:DnaJ-domain-containing protein 1
MQNVEIPDKLKAHFLRLYQMAICDDDFSAIELKMLYSFAEDRGITAKNLDELLLRPINSKSHFPESIEDKIEYLHDLSLMIWADGIVDDNERAALEKYIKMFGFLEENIPQIADYFLDAAKSGKTKESIIQEFKD